MKVLVLASEFPPILGGVSTFAHSLADGFARLGHSVRVMTCSGETGTTLTRRMTVTRLRAPRRFRRAGTLAVLLVASFGALLRDRSALLVCTRLSLEGIAAIAARRLLGVRYILVVHGSEVLQHRGRLLHEVVRIILAGATHVIANSRYTGRLVRDFGIPPARLSIVNPPIRPEDYEPPSSAVIDDVRQRFGLTGRRILLTVGQLTARKGHALVIESMRELKSRFPDVAYAIVGGAGEARKQLESMVDGLNLRDDVVFTGYLPAPELRALYGACEIFVMPCRELERDVEGFGIAFAEANLFGKPVIAGIGGGTGDAVSDGETGLLVDPADPRAVPTAIARLLENRELARRFGENGRRHVIEHLSLSAQLPRLRDVLAAAAEATRGSRSPAVARPGATLH